jgi:hypothetical protein
MDTKTARIRALNDELRQRLTGGMAVITPGVAALGQEAVDRIVKTIEVYDDFCHANDPHEEHDFGAFEADGKQVIFKIDYFDSTLTYHSPDPSDPNVTKRVITIMLAEEYGLPGQPHGFYRLVGRQAGRILKGERVAELAVTGPRKFELVVNLKTATALHLTVPASILGSSDQVIE